MPPVLVVITDVPDFKVLTAQELALAEAANEYLAKVEGNSPKAFEQLTHTEMLDAVLLAINVDWIQARAKELVKKHADALVKREAAELELEVDRVYIAEKDARRIQGLADDVDREECRKKVLAAKEAKAKPAKENKPAK